MQSVVLLRLDWRLKEKFLYGNRDSREALFSDGSHMGTKVPIQHPFWGGVSPLLPMRSIVFFFGAWTLPGNGIFPSRTGTGPMPSGHSIRRRKDASQLTQPLPKRNKNVVDRAVAS